MIWCFKRNVKLKINSTIYHPSSIKMPKKTERKKNVSTPVLSVNPGRRGLPTAHASAAVKGSWAVETEQPDRAASGSSEQGPGGNLLPAELHGPESLPLPEPPHRAAGQTQTSHRHRERGNTLFLIFSTHTSANNSVAHTVLFLLTDCFIETIQPKCTLCMQLCSIV